MNVYQKPAFKSQKKHTILLVLELNGLWWTTDSLFVIFSSSYSLTRKDDMPINWAVPYSLFLFMLAKMQKFFFILINSRYSISLIDEVWVSHLKKLIQVTKKKKRKREKK